MSTALEVGKQIVALCQAQQNAQAIETLYADDVVSIEAMEGPEMPREMKGKEAVLAKGKWWVDNHEVHSAQVKGPLMHGDDQFALIFNYDVTFKPQSLRMQLEEVGVYTVKDGKIAHEAFFYTMGE